jgi:histidyl-tRNA synthetase
MSLHPVAPPPRSALDLLRAGTGGDEAALFAGDMAFGGYMKKRLSRANDSGAAFALIIGDNELDSGEVQVKRLSTGEQHSVAFDAIAEALCS